MTPFKPGSHETRRGFLKTAALAGSAALLPLALPAQAAARTTPAVTPGDVALLKFLAVAELLEADLWGQYSELAQYNSGFHDALVAIDPSLPRYANDTHDDELSHANFINAFLASLGEEPVNLDAFRTIAPPNVQGINQSEKRLTNLTNLTVDTSWYTRYRSPKNADFGASFPQLLDITNRPAVPTSDSMTTEQLQAVAQTAAFHFCMIEQGGSGLYTNFIQKATNSRVVQITCSIGPTEVYHFATFQGSLEGIAGLDTGDGLVFPDLKNMDRTAQAIMPEPCDFLRLNLPLCSIIRPGGTSHTGALAAAVGLAQSGLFAGQPDAFVNAAVGLAQAADAVTRTV